MAFPLDAIPPKLFQYYSIMWHNLGDAEYSLVKIESGYKIIREGTQLLYLIPKLKVGTKLPEKIQNFKSEYKMPILRIKVHVIEK